MKRQIRELVAGDVGLVIDYFLKADRHYLQGMGVEPDKLPTEADWRALLLEDLERPVREKQFYYLAWCLDGAPIGHSNINKIKFGQEAFMHLHLWEAADRRAGLGTHFVTDCVSVYFQQFDLETLFCEPYALNPAPNRILEKVGFEFVEKYETVPGWINFRQEVNRWMLTKESWSRRQPMEQDDTH